MPLTPWRTSNSPCKDSYDAGAWDTGQFRCSTANGTHGLGWKDDGGANTITIARALSGDADLDGVVDLSDLSLVVANWNGAGKIWADGDFNYDGTANLADMSLLAQNWNAKLGKGDVLLSGNSTFDVDLSDDGPDMIDVTGAVRLDNATLNVTSTRSPTDDSGILRVLIRNEGGNPVMETFNNLPEGAGSYPATVGTSLHTITTPKPDSSAPATTWPSTRRCLASHSPPLNTTCKTKTPSIL